MRIRILFILLLTVCFVNAQTYIEKNYNKTEYKIEMRDGVKLFTSVYSPKDTSISYPVLLSRTPYSSKPYGKEYRDINEYLLKEKFIFVFQDVRGMFMSEGEYENMRPIKSDKDPYAVNEATDTYDTIDWLINNVPNNNGKIGIFGISYPGFYSAVSLVNSHPALKCVSPQAPISDWFIGDDMHHHGALSLLLTFNFFSVFGQDPDTLYTEWPAQIEFSTPDAYNFFLELGPLKNANENYFKGKISFWNEVMKNDTYTTFWKEKNTLPHFENVSPAVLTVGGWYDGENLFGALNTYASIEEKNPGLDNRLVMGPWIHGGWVRTTGESLGDVKFGKGTFDFYSEEIELPFFRHYLKDGPVHLLPEATVFETGSNTWHKYDSWPPQNVEEIRLYPGAEKALLFNKQSESRGYCEFVSDPANPVPYTSKIQDARKFYHKPYMTEDQRFVSSRPDVLTFESEILQETVTISGPLFPELYVSTTGTDADWVVKIIDVHPDSASEKDGVEWGGYEELIRGDIFRGKFRNSYEKPEPFIPGEVTKVSFKMQDINHTFKPGHKIQIQIQSSWFPLFDRNPQTFTNINEADEDDFIKATHKVYYGEQYPSAVRVYVKRKK